MVTLAELSFVEFDVNIDIVRRFPSVPPDFAFTSYIPDTYENFIDLYWFFCRASSK